MGAGVAGFAPGARVGVPWLGRTCGHCPYCRRGRENLCDDPLFTGYTRDGGYATHRSPTLLLFPAAGRRRRRDSGAAALRRAHRLAHAEDGGAGGELGIYGFGAAAHIIAQVAILQGRRVYAFVRPGDDAAAHFALSLGAAGARVRRAPAGKLDAALIFAPVGALVPLALAAVKKGGARRLRRHSHERHSGLSLRAAVGGAPAPVSRQSHARRRARFLALAPTLPLTMHSVPYALSQANEALADLRDGRLQGAAVLVP